MPSIKHILADTKGAEKLAVEIWLGFLLERDRTWLFVHEEDEVPDQIVEKFNDGLKQILAGKPVAQLIGIKEFYGLSFVVNEHVLIPRPESELIVDLAKDFIQENFPENLPVGKVKIADIGTGSGCILLSILKGFSFAEGIGVEISDEALKIAQQNAEKLILQDKVRLIKGSLLEPLNEPVQIIVANLPYIGRDEYHFVDENVDKYEPQIALYGGSHGLEMYEDMFAQLNNKSWKPAVMMGEFGFGQEELMNSILQKYFAEEQFEIIPDLAGIPRVFVVNFAVNRAKN